MFASRAGQRILHWLWCCIVLCACGRDRTALGRGQSESNGLVGGAAESTGSGDTGADAPEPVASVPDTGAIESPPAVNDGEESVAPPGPDAGTDDDGLVVDPIVCGGARQPCCAEGPACGAQLSCGESGLCVECMRFVALPQNPGAGSSNVSRLSGDGRIVVANAGASQAYWLDWRSSNTATILSPLEGDTQSFVSGVSRDGGVVIGGSAGPNGTRAVRWAQDGVAEPLGTLERALSVSADGAIVVGSDANGAARWSAPGVVEPIGSMDEVSDVSADGRSIAGRRFDAAGPGADRGVLDSGDGGALVGALPGDVTSSALLISGDGTVVVGLSIDTLAQSHTFRWQAGTTRLIDGFSALDDINGDGSVVVGGASSEACGGSTAIWRQDSGTEHVECLLPPGLLPEGWRLLRATGVSEDGSAVTGFGVNPAAQLQSWVAVLGPVCGS